MDKMKEKVIQVVYGAIIGGLAGVGLVIMVKEKTFDKIKKIWYIKKDG